jgi:hypothetical protein
MIWKKNHQNNNKKKKKIMKDCGKYDTLVKYKRLKMNDTINHNIHEQQLV